MAGSVPADARISSMTINFLACHSAQIKAPRFQQTVVAYMVKLVLDFEEHVDSTSTSHRGEACCCEMRTPFYSRFDWFISALYDSTVHICLGIKVDKVFG
jgi:hypothetical protein